MTVSKISRISQQNIKNGAVFAAFFVLIYWFIYRNLVQLGLLALPHSAFYIRDPKEALLQLLSAWNYAGLGFRATNVGFLYEEILLGLFVITRNAVLVQKMLLVVPMPLASITMYSLLGRMIKSQNLRWALSLAYGLNPLMIAEFLAGTYSILIVYAIFPLLILYTDQFFKTDLQMKYAVVIAILLSLMGGIYIRSLLWGITTFFSFALLHIAEQRNLKFLVRVTTRLIFIGAIVVVLLAPLAVSTAVSMVRADQSLLLRGYTVSGMGGHIKSFYFTFAREGDVIYFSLPAGMLLLYEKYIDDRGRKRFLISALSVIVGLIIVFGALRVSGWVPSDILAVWLFYFFEYPTLLMGWLMFLYIIALGAIIGGINLPRISFRLKLRRTRKKGSLRKLGLLFLTLTLLSTWLYGYNRFNSHQIFNAAYFTSAQIPDAYFAFANLLGNYSDIPFRTLWLPMPPSAKPNFFGILYYFDRTSLSTIPSEKLINIFNALVKNETQNFGLLIAPLSVKYIIIDLNATKYYGEWAAGPPRLAGILPVGDPLKYAQILNKQKDLRLIQSNKELLIYENIVVIPPISVYQGSFGISMNHSQLSPNVAPSFLIFKDGPTSFTLSGSFEGPFYVVLSQAYDTAWNAYAGENKLKHVALPPYNLNLFYTNQSIKTTIIRITYVYQSLYEAAYIVSNLGYLAVIPYVLNARVLTFVRGRWMAHSRECRTIDK